MTMLMWLFISATTTPCWHCGSPQNVWRLFSRPFHALDWLARGQTCLGAGPARTGSNRLASRRWRRCQLTPPSAFRPMSRQKPKFCFDGTYRDAGGIHDWRLTTIPRKTQHHYKEAGIVCSGVTAVTWHKAIIDSNVLYNSRALI